MRCKAMQTTKELDGRSQSLAARRIPREVPRRLRRHGRAFLIAAAVMSAMLWTDSVMAAAESSVAARDVVTHGAIETGVVTGFVQGTTAIGHAQSANRSAVLVLPRVGMVLTDPLGESWWQGNVELLVEPLFARFTKPFAAEAAGGSLVVQYNFLSFGRWMPFWQAGAGMVWTNLAPRIPEQSAQFEFLLDTGLGVHYFMTETLTLTTAVRLHHLSNAGIGDRNVGGQRRAGLCRIVGIPAVKMERLSLCLSVGGSPTGSGGIHCWREPHYAERHSSRKRLAASGV